MAQLLCHIPDKEKAERVHRLCTGMNIGLRTVTVKDADTALGSLLGMPMAAAGKKAPPLWPMPELLIFCGFDDGQLDRFLAAWRAAGIAPVALKAVVTPYNIGWSLYELAGELEREHKEMTGRG